MRASFWAIYKRSRFSSRGLSDEARMEQRERFGAACLALCLQHDRQFCRRFTDLCGVPLRSTLWAVYVDPYREGWADILLQGHGHTIVVECKIADDVMPKQNPWHSKNAFTKLKEGYGARFRTTFPSQQRAYILLTATNHGNEKLVHETRCRSVTWSDVASLAKPTDQWARDLFLSLGNLNYPTFREMKVANLHVETIESVLASHEVLGSVAQSLGLAGWKIQHSAEKEDIEGPITGGYIGIENRLL